MLKTNVHPYVYMTKYALQHFENQSQFHKHKNAMIYLSSGVSEVAVPYFGPYSGTKMHNDRLASTVGKLCRKSTAFGDLVDIQSVHPGGV
jgi:short-subunit dehydrogenase